jgi:hypothetical protein
MLSVVSAECHYAECRYAECLSEILINKAVFIVLGPKSLR